MRRRQVAVAHTAAAASINAITYYWRSHDGTLAKDGRTPAGWGYSSPSVDCPVFRTHSKGPAVIVAPGSAHLRRTPDNTASRIRASQDGARALLVSSLPVTQWPDRGATAKSLGYASETQHCLFACIRAASVASRLLVADIGPRTWCRYDPTVCLLGAACFRRRPLI